MPGLHIAKVAILLKAQVPLNQLQANLPASVDRFGELLAEQVIAYVQEQQLGYFPALDYFQQNNTGVQSFLLDAAVQIADVTIAYTKREVLNALIPVFSTVHIETIHVTAFTLPSVRPACDKSLQDLARHLTPDTVKMELHVSIIQKHDATEGVDKGAARIAHRWLNEKFNHVDIITARLL